MHFDTTKKKYRAIASASLSPIAFGKSYANTSRVASAMVRISASAKISKP
ncbi:hypothetical protein LEP1GSC038_4797 [Leptospira weilii str. 2006001855]|uniref:Uncharacterized protein n=1 Tax=Leptospira weilii str. 2006001855 TaxID=996804 RepID=M6FW77_9LEPT|nr:hypothetical protein LEP1GSC038_4797 [Leptospira weilii str. 2006001855]